MMNGLPRSGLSHLILNRVFFLWCFYSFNFIVVTDYVYITNLAHLKRCGLILRSFLFFQNHTGVHMTPLNSK